MNVSSSPDLEGLRRAFPYPVSSPGAITVLGEKMAAEISERAPLPFREFMTRCLYDPEHGYYSRPLTPTVSKDGDFITSVSVGPCFGLLLARRLESFWEAVGKPDEFAVVEIGGHDGSLARDILAGMSPTFQAAARYHLIEPLSTRRAFLRKQLGDRVEVHAEHRRLGAFGALVANEVLDALPVPLYLFSGGHWREVAVDFDENFTWTTLPEEAADFAAERGTNFLEGYVTEGPPPVANFLTPLTMLFDHGLMTFIDYGLDEESLYAPERTIGTLRCYHRHRLQAHPLDRPGEQDLTADVNFTAVEHAARQLSLIPCPVLNQSRYLTWCAKSWLTATPTPSPDLIRQFQTLIHPSQFGTRFYALELLHGDVPHGFPS